MTVPDRNSGCPDPETLAAFAEGKLKRHELPPVLAHLDTCGDCMSAVKAVSETVTAPQARFRFAWLAAAAVIAMALLAVPALRRGVTAPFAHRSSLAQLVDLSPRSARLVEVRLSGGFPWAPYRGPLRASEPATDARRLKLAGAAGDLVDRADHERTPDAQHAAGVALVMIERPEDAIARLRSAAESPPPAAKRWSDLAAAQYATALRSERPSLYPEALAACDRALRIDPELPEALFNRALVLQRLGLSQEARAAWQRYLQTDPSSPWAAEAREHLASLPAATGESLFRRDLPRLEKAAEAGDQAAVVALVGRYRQPGRLYAEAESLGQWGEALLRGDAAVAARELTFARSVGDALARLSGESLLREAVRAIDEADPARRSSLAGAHALYRRGRMTYSRSAPAAAEPDLRRATALFAAAGSPMSLVARYYAANTRFDQNDVAGARAALETLLQEVDARPQFAALGAQVRWQLAVCHIADGDWTATLPLLAEAEAVFRRLGERSHQGFIEAMQASALVSTDRLDEGWGARIRSFAALDAESSGDRLTVSLGEAVRTELGAGRFEPARALLELEESIDRAAGNDVLLSNALVREAVLHSRLGDGEAAARNAREAFAAAQRIDDPAMRARAVADAQFAAGAAALRSDPRGAETLLTKAIDHYRATGKALFLPESHLLRARAELQLGQRDDAVRDLESGVADLERHRLAFAGAVVGTGALNAGAALFDEAIRLSLDRHDVARTFSYAERSRGRRTPAGDASPAITLAELQRRLAGSGTAVLVLRSLPGEVVGLCVTADDGAVARHPVAPGLLAALADRGLDADQDALRELYDVLIRPSEPAIGSARSLIVVGDPLLQALPFAALYDGAQRRYLVERMSVAVGESASSLVSGAAGAAPRTIAAVALAPAEASHAAPALPDARDELGEIARLYPRTIEITPGRATFSALLNAAAQADVIHIAGHTERQPGAGDAALIFAGRAGGERVSWRKIAATPLERPAIVVLAACETLRTARWSRGQSPSLGGGFLTAGAEAVIGTLTPVADRDARQIFRAIHRQLAAGFAAAEAVRRAQLEALSEESANHRRTAWRAVALLTRRIPHDGA
jgi:tetratricopeptide (TPR) repeat protein